MVENYYPIKMKVFIENEAGSKFKNLFDEKKLEFKKTIQVSRAYPYPYGFILNTTGEDGDNVDVFVLTKKLLKKGEVVESGTHQELLDNKNYYHRMWENIRL